MVPTFAVAPALKAIFELAKEGKQAPGLHYGFDRVLHGEQYTEIRSLWPTSGKLIHKIKIKDIFDKGKNALVINAITTTDADGNELGLAVVPDALRAHVPHSVVQPADRLQRVQHSGIDVGVVQLVLALGAFSVVAALVVAALREFHRMASQDWGAIPPPQLMFSVTYALASLVALWGTSVTARRRRAPTTESPGAAD
jgi:hypothetical protein